MENPDRVTYFAATDARGQRVPFGIKQKDRSRHMYVIGKTGMGKSTLLENMAIQDIRNGEGLAFIDPHGGTAEKLLEYIPKDRIDDVVYFAPFDMENPIAFNVMEDVGYDKRHLVVSGLMATFKKIWVDAWSARMEYILSNTLLALLEYPGATLLGVNRMYTDKVYRKLVVDNIKDTLVKDFWTKEFAGYTDRYVQEATPAIQNKIGQFTSNPLIRNIIGQSKSSFDIREMMDNKKILIINLSKGLVGDTNMQLLGSMITTRIFLAAMSRADITGNDLVNLPNFYFYVDEFQNFANETFAEILSEARKYKLNLIIAHQYIEQMEEEVRDAVFGNVGTTVVFRVGPFDAEVLETVFLPEFTKEDLVNLGFAQVYLTLMIDGIGSRPFSALTIAPIEPPLETFKEMVVSSSRNKFAYSRKSVESFVEKELESTVIKKNTSFSKNKTHNTNDFNKTKPISSNGHGEKIPSNVVSKNMIRPAFDTNTKDNSNNVYKKTSETLKDTLRSVALKATSEKQNTTTTKQKDLKNTLADILRKTKTDIVNKTATSEALNNKKENPHQINKGVDTKKAGVDTNTKNTKTNIDMKTNTNIESNHSFQREQKKPFEVPEKTLKDILKGNG